MESLTTWAEEDGQKIEPYGLDLIGSLAERARERLPHPLDRVFAGNAIDWRPPIRCDFACANLELVPAPPA